MYVLIQEFNTDVFKGLRGKQAFFAVHIVSVGYSDLFWCIVFMFVEKNVLYETTACFKYDLLGEETVRST